MFDTGDGKCPQGVVRFETSLGAEAAIPGYPSRRWCNPGT